MTDESFDIADFSQEMVLSTYTNYDAPFMPRVLLEVLRCLKIPSYMNGVYKTKVIFQMVFRFGYFPRFNRLSSDNEFINNMTLFCLHMCQSSSLLFDLFLVCSFIDEFLADEIECAVGEDGCFRYMELASKSLLIVLYKRFKQLFDDPRGRQHIQAYCKIISEYYDAQPLDNDGYVIDNPEEMGLFLTGSETSLQHAYRLLSEGKINHLIDFKLTKDELLFETNAIPNVSDVTEYNWTRNFMFEHYYPTYTCKEETNLNLSIFKGILNLLPINVAFPKYAAQSIITKENHYERESTDESEVSSDDEWFEKDLEICANKWKRLRCTKLISDDDTNSSLYSPRFSIFHEATCRVCKLNCFGIIVRCIEKHRSKYPDEKTIQEIRKTSYFSMYKKCHSDEENDETLESKEADV